MQHINYRKKKINITIICSLHYCSTYLDNVIQYVMNNSTYSFYIYKLENLYYYSELKQILHK